MTNFLLFIYIFLDLASTTHDQDLSKNGIKEEGDLQIEKQFTEIMKILFDEEKFSYETIETSSNAFSKSETFSSNCINDTEDEVLSSRSTNIENGEKSSSANTFDKDLANKIGADILKLLTPIAANCLAFNMEQHLMQAKKLKKLLELALNKMKSYTTKSEIVEAQIKKLEARLTKINDRIDNVKVLNEEQQISDLVNPIIDLTHHLSNGVNNIFNNLRTSLSDVEPTTLAETMQSVGNLTQCSNDMHDENSSTSAGTFNSPNNLSEKMINDLIQEADSILKRHEEGILSDDDDE